MHLADVALGAPIPGEFEVAGDEGQEEGAHHSGGGEHPQGKAPVPISHGPLEGGNDGEGQENESGDVGEGHHGDEL